MHVLNVEGPIYEDVLLRRIARAHGLQRVGHLVREAVLDQVPASIARTEDDDRPVLWPPDTEPLASHPYRTAASGLRNHTDTPMAELVGLAGTIRSEVPKAERVRLMAQTIGLSRVEASTRARFERATELACQIRLS
nr:DUF3320 domain-containing protein [Methylorubrum aminovorans]